MADAGAIALIDGQDGIGQVLSARMAREAIKRAKAHGIGAAGVRNSNHFGTAMYYTRMAAEAGCVAFLSTNASPAMAPWGGRKKTVGTNPWSIAAPAGARAPMMLDIANTGVARGKLQLDVGDGAAPPKGIDTTAPQRGMGGAAPPAYERITSPGPARRGGGRSSWRRS